MRNSPAKDETSTRQVPRIRCMEPENRRRAAAAVALAMERNRWSADDLAEEASIGVDTVQDFLSARRWPRRASRNAIEDALGWDPGRIAEVAAQANEPAGGDDEDRLDLSALSPRNRHRLMAFYYELLENQEGDDSPPTTVAG